MLSELKHEAMDIVEELHLMEVFLPYVEARIVGSVALDLIVKLDIDIHVLVETPNLLGVVNMIYPELLSNENVSEVRISDFRDKGGVKLGIDSYKGISGDWSIDIWITNNSETTGFRELDYLREMITPEHREIIMSIKTHYHQMGLLRNGISTLIYEAVVKKGVKNIHEFEASTF